MPPMRQRKRGRSEGIRSRSARRRGLSSSRNAARSSSHHCRRRANRSASRNGERKAGRSRSKARPSRRSPRVASSSSSSRKPRLRRRSPSATTRESTSNLSRSSRSRSRPRTLSPLSPSSTADPAEQKWRHVRTAFADLLKQLRKESPPSEWCQDLLESGCCKPNVDQELSALEQRHVRKSGTKKELMSFAPTARELIHRAHEMRAGIASDAAWDPCDLLALPSDVIEDLSRAFERRGCRGLGIAEALCLPFVLYSTDTIHILRLSVAMRRLWTLRTPCSASAVRDELGIYAGVVCALVETGALLRRYVTPKRLLSVLSMQTERFLEKRLMVFRGLWLPKDFSIADLCRCHSFTSWSLWPRGALSVLEVYHGRVDADASMPVLVIALQEDIMRSALPTTALYFAASPDGKAVGKQGRPRECLPKSRLRPVMNDAGVAQGEKEIVLPPFCRLHDIESPGVVSLSDICKPETTQQLADAWNLSSSDAKRISKELEGAWQDATKGGKSLRKRDVKKCVCLFIRRVTGSWFEEEDSD